MALKASGRELPPSLNYDQRHVAFDLDHPFYSNESTCRQFRALFRGM
jgi:hypothetical protein